MAGSDRGQKQSPQRYQTSFQQLMAQRYPQPDRSGNQSGSASTSKPNGNQTQSQTNPQKANESSHGQPGLAFGSTAPKGTSPPSLTSFKSGSTVTSKNQVASSHRPGTTAGSAKQSSSKSSSSAKRDSSSRQHGSTSGIVFGTPDQKHNLDHCDWKDKVLWAARLILGGNSVNGFLRATATAQRIKKQRARQLALTKKSAAAAAAAAAGTTVEEQETEKPKDSTKKAFDQVEEEKLKKDIMNPRTAKKIKGELEAGVQFCVTLHNLLRGVILEVDPDQIAYLPASLLPEDKTSTPSTLIPSALGRPSSNATATSSKVSAQTDSSMPWTIKSNTSPKLIGGLGTQAIGSTKQPFPRQLVPAQTLPPSTSGKTTASPGNASGSTLRKMRKKKLPPSMEPPVNLPEFDASGKRICTKKEHNYRLFEILRFRPLKEGDFVAARLSSRDLWILARVQKDYSGVDISPLDFLNLSEARRDALFRESVLVKDVEDKDNGGPTQVARSLALPLPRTYSEAAEWGSRLKKGSRVYAMYPQTTSLYPATVTDCTTYCREDDDIIIVEFDGEDPDITGQVPKYHIPARFVTLIAKEFAASQPFNATNKNKRKGGAPLAAAPAKREKKPEDDLFSLDFGGADAFGNFDSLDLDFDKPLGADEEQDDFPPIM